MSDYRIAAEWLRYARNDLVVAKHCIEDLYPRQTEIASYHRYALYDLGEDEIKVVER